MEEKTMRKVIVAGNWKMYKNNKEAVETKNQQENIVPVAANPTAKNASDAVVMPESAKNDKGVSQTTVRTETQVQQDSVVH